jgi:hypothetical protein
LKLNFITSLNYTHLVHLLLQNVLYPVQTPPLPPLLPPSIMFFNVLCRVKFTCNYR